MRKSPKSELAREIEKNVDTPPPPDVPRDNESCMIAIDFMAYARKVAVSKLKLKAFGDFAKHLWQTFSHLSRGCSRLDIIFDLYIEQSIKEHERERRSKADGINTAINRRDQPLPVDMNRFWSSTTNKVRLQQFFINWVCENYKDQIPVYLGGSHENDLSACLRVTDGRGNYVRLLKCDHEEADDRIM